MVRRSCSCLERSKLIKGVRRPSFFIYRLRQFASIRCRYCCPKTGLDASESSRVQERAASRLGLSLLIITVHGVVGELQKWHDECTMAAPAVVLLDAVNKTSGPTSATPYWELITMTSSSVSIALATVGGITSLTKFESRTSATPRDENDDVGVCVAVDTRHRQ
jgi:hypothetical protein